MKTIFFHFLTLLVACNATLSISAPDFSYVLRFSDDSYNEEAVTPIEVNSSMGFLEIPQMGLSSSIVPTRQPNPQLNLFVNSSRKDWLGYLEICYSVFLNDACTLALEESCLSTVRQSVEKSLGFWPAFFQWKAQNGLCPDALGLCSCVPYPTEPQKCIAMWSQNGHILYPMVFEEELRMEGTVPLGKGSHGNCLLIPQIDSPIFYFHQASGPPGVVVYKQLNAEVYSMKVDDSFWFNLDEINFFVACNLHPYGSHTVVVQRQGLRGRISGFLSDYAQCGTLKDFLVQYSASREHLTRFFVGELRSLARAIHQIHQCGYLHRDISLMNILVTPYRYGDFSSGYTFKVSDFGISCKKTDHVCLVKGQSYRKGIRYPIEFFRNRLKASVNERSDWYQFGYLLVGVAARLESRKRSVFLGYFFPLIEMLTRYNPGDRIWNYAEIDRYFGLILADQSDARYLANHGFIMTFTICHPFDKNATVQFLDEHKKAYNCIDSRQEIKNQTLHFCYELQYIGGSSVRYMKAYRGGRRGLVSLFKSEILSISLKPMLFRFVKDFPHQICGSITQFIPQMFFGGQIISISTNTLNSVCFCQNSCSLSKNITPGCHKTLNHTEFQAFFNQNDNYIEAI